MENKEEEKVEEKAKYDTKGNNNIIPTVLSDEDRKEQREQVLSFSPWFLLRHFWYFLGTIISPKKFQITF